MRIGEMMRGILHSKLFRFLRQKGADMADDVSCYLGQKAGEMHDGFMDSYLDKKISLLKNQAVLEMKKIKSQIVKYVIIGFVIQTAVLIGILFLFF
jgi:hypothetical protein